MLKVVSHLDETPAAPAQFLYLSVDGTFVPSDFYLSLAGNFTARSHARLSSSDASATHGGGSLTTGSAVWSAGERARHHEAARLMTEQRLAARRPTWL